MSATFEGHSSRITDVAYSDDGKFILSGSYDKTVKLWDFGVSTSVLTFAWNSALNLLAVGLEDGGVKLYDVRYADKQFTLDQALADSPESERVGPVTSLAWQGNRLLVGSHDQTCSLYRIEAGALTPELTYKHGDFCTSVGFGKGFFASGSFDRTVAFHKLP